MIVDSATFEVLPIADQFLVDPQGHPVGTLDLGMLDPDSPGAGAPEQRRQGDIPLAWSNELVLHVLELKNPAPTEELAGLAEAFAAAIRAANRSLRHAGACLMPTGMHPLMDPKSETRLWPHEGHDIYASYDRIFGCHSHGYANLQSVHLNLPFRGDEEFARLHTAIRTLLPLIPALTASSPYIEGRFSGLLDGRLEVYRTNASRVPTMTGAVVPEPVRSHQQYVEQILQPMYRQIAPFDPDGLLADEWLNARGAIARFDRSAIARHSHRNSDRRSGRRLCSVRLLPFCPSALLPSNQPDVDTALGRAA